MKKKQSVLRNQKGFTLIEVVIVLLLLGLAIWLVTNQLADPVTKARRNTSVNSITRSFTSIEQAALNQALEKTKAATIAELVTKGYLKVDPTPPEGGENASATTGTYAYQLATTLGGANVTGFGGAGLDTVVKIDRIDPEICNALDVKQGLIAEGDATPAAVNYIKNIQCYGAGQDFTAVMPVYVQ